MRGRGAGCTLVGLCILFTVTCVYCISSCWSTEREALSEATLCYYGLLLPQLLPISVAFLVLNWLGLKFFIHN